MSKPRIVVIGAGLIGRKHIELVQREARLAAIVDPSDTAKEIAETKQVLWAASIEEYLESNRPDGAIIATPNQLHVDHASACIAAGIPVLIEKPIAEDAERADAMVKQAKSAKVPILVGHHRRYNPIIKATKDAIIAGKIGDIVSVNAQFWLYKPDDYFDVEWRTKTGAGPVFINLIHDVDLLRYLCGDIDCVQAMSSNATRGIEVEDTASILLKFTNGALGTVSVSDTVVAPWSWELTAAENPAYPATGMSCYQIGGTQGSISLPDLTIWSQPEKRGWWDKIERSQLACEVDDPLILQIRHFCDVIRDQADPIVSGLEGLMSLRAINAIQQASATGAKINL